LLELVGHDWRVRFSILTHCKSLLTVSDGVVQDLFTAGKTHRRDTNTTRQQTIRYLEKSLASLRNITNEFTLLVDICQSIQHVDTGNFHLIKFKSCVVDTIKTHFHTHVFDKDSLARLHFLVSNRHDKSINTFVLSFDNSLSKDYSVVGVASTIRNPKLL
jgi:hypothetical protein